MSKVKDSSRIQELASELIDSNQAPAIQGAVVDDMIGEDDCAVVSRQRSPEDSDEEGMAKKAVASNYDRGVYADLSISVPKSDRDRSRTVRRARKRLRAARRMERRTESQRVQRYKTVPENRSKLLY